MARRIVAAGETRRLDLGDGDWVEIKRRLTVGDREAINSAVSSDLRGEQKDGVTAVSGVNWALAFGATLRCAIVAWGGPGFCVHDHEDGSTHDDTGASNGCGAIPISSANIAALDDVTGNTIGEALSKSDPRPSKEETAHP